MNTADSDAVASLTFLRQLRNGAEYDLSLDFGTVALQTDNAQSRAASIINRLDDLATTGADS